METVWIFLLLPFLCDLEMYEATSCDILRESGQKTTKCSSSSLQPLVVNLMTDKNSILTVRTTLHPATSKTPFSLSSKLSLGGQVFILTTTIDILKGHSSLNICSVTSNNLLDCRRCRTKKLLSFFTIMYTVAPKNNLVQFELKANGMSMYKKLAFISKNNQGLTVTLNKFNVADKLLEFNEATLNYDVPVNLPQVTSMKKVRKDRQLDSRLTSWKPDEIYSIDIVRPKAIKRFTAIVKQYGAIRFTTMDGDTALVSFEKIDAKTTLVTLNEKYKIKLITENKYDKNMIYGVGIYFYNKEASVYVTQQDEEYLTWLGSIRFPGNTKGFKSIQLKGFEKMLHFDIQGSRYTTHVEKGVFYHQLPTWLCVIIGLCGILLIVTIVIVLVCCRQRSRKQADSQADNNEAPDKNEVHGKPNSGCSIKEIINNPSYMDGHSRNESTVLASATHNNIYYVAYDESSDNL